MKKVWLILLVLAALLLSACSGQTTLEVDGVSYTVDWKEKSLSDGENTYTFQQTTADGKKVITVIYPNGAQVSRTYFNEYSWTDSSKNADIRGYASFDALVTGINSIAGDRKVNVPMILGGLLLVGIGVAGVAIPESIWRISEGWKYESAEPSEFLMKIYATVGMISIIGGVAIILGGILGAT